MKKASIFILLFVFAGMGSAWSQCATANCTNYAVSPITFSTYPLGSTPIAVGDDVMSGTIQLGFTFTFYCNAYTQADVSSNGFMTFDLNTGNSQCCNGMPIPSFGGSPDANNYIAPFWNDLNPGTGGSITYTTIGIAPNRMFVLTYTDVPHYGNAGLLNSAQVVLYETTNVIEIHTSLVTNDGSNCTQGAENSTGTLGAWNPTLNATTNAGSNFAYRFSTILPTPPPAVTGFSTACQNGAASFSVGSNPGVLGYVWTLPGGWSGTSTTSVINATVGAAGNISVSAVYTCGISTPITMSFNTIPLPIVTIQNPTPSIICSGSTVGLNTGGAVTYTLEPGSNSSGPPFILNPMTTTTYTLYGTNASGCVSNNSPTTEITVKPSPTVIVNSGTICLGQSFTISPSGASTYTMSSAFSVVTPTVTGLTTYTVIGTNSTGCVSDPAYCNLIVNALPPVLASATRTNICRQESVTIAASGATSYSWNIGATVPSTLVSPNVTTVYSVTGLDANLCSKMATVQVVVSLCTGVSENGEKLSFIKVFPNPSSGEYNVQLQSSCNVEVFDFQGKLILSQKLSEGSHKVDLTRFASGQYLLKANDGNRQQEILLIKE